MSAMRVPAPTPGRFAAVAPTTCPGCCSPSHPGAGFAVGHGIGSACGHPVYPHSKCPFRQQQPGMQSPCQRLCAALGVPGDGQRGRVGQGVGGRGTSWCQHPGGDRALGSQQHRPPGRCSEGGPAATGCLHPKALLQLWWGRPQQPRAQRRHRCPQPCSDTIPIMAEGLAQPLLRAPHGAKPCHSHRQPRLLSPKPRPSPRGRHGRSRARGATPPPAGRSRTLAPCWCAALMLGKAYLLLGCYLHPLSLSAAGQPSCLRHVPGACLQQVWSALLLARAGRLRRRLPAVPDSGARGDNVRAARTLAIAFPMTLPCPPHSSNATHAFARGCGQARRMAACADGAQAALVVSSRGDSLTYQSHSSA